MTKKKNPAAVSLGAKGGRARAKKLSKAELSAIGKKAAAGRWSASEKAALEKAADEYRLTQAREIFKKLGYVQGPGDKWTKLPSKKGGK
jgi:hypothetical protein